jgi:hypothetical protein
MNAIKLLNLLKQYHFFESNKKIEMKEIAPIRNHSNGKRHVKFINQKMILPMMILIEFLVPKYSLAKIVQNTDACTVTVTATSVDVVNAGCGGGGIEMNIGSSELFAFEVRSVLAPDLVLVSSLYYESGTIQTGPWLNAGDYLVNVTTISGCTGEALVTVNQPACETIEPIIETVPVSVNGATDGQVSFNFTAGNSCLGSWYFQIMNSATNSLITNGLIADPITSPGILSSSYPYLSAGEYTLEIYKGTTENVPSNCSYSYNFTITEPACNITNTPTFVNPSASSCGNGSIFLNLTGNTALGYYVVDLYPQDGGLASQYYVAEDDDAGVFEIASLSGGNYEVIVNNGVNNTTCTVQAMVMLTEPVCDLSVNSFVTSNSSAAGCNNGSVNFNLTGETCYDSYLVTLYKDGIDQGTLYLAETSGVGTYSNSILGPGNYTVNVSNGALYCSITESFTITEPLCDITIVDFTSNNPTVNIGNNGSVLFNAQGGSCDGSYYYELYNSGSFALSGYISVSGTSSPTEITGLAEGNHELKLYSYPGSSCVTSLLFSLNNESCNIAINNLNAQNITANGCGNGTLNFIASGNTAYGYYTLLIEKDGSYYNSINITPTGPTTAFSVSDLTVGAYSLTLSDGYSNPCTASATINITQQACNIQIINPVIDEETTSQQTVVASVTGSIAGNSCDGNYLVNLIQTDGSVFASQTVPVTNPNFLFENVTAGIYSIKAYPGVVNESCVDQHDFILVDPCPTSSLAFDIDSTGGPCTFSTVHVTVTGSTDASKLYTVEYRLDGGAWTTAHGPYFGHTGTHTFDMYLSMDGYYEFRSGPLVVLPTCPVLSGLSIYKKYCDAYQTSTHVNNASNGCNNGSVNVYFTDPIKCLANVYHAKVYQAGIEVATMICSPVSGNNYVATAQLPAGSYSYTIFTEGDFTGLDLGCPLNGTFIIGTENCTLSISNETIYNNCTGSDYSAQVNGVTCNGSYLVELYKDGLLQSSNPITEYSGTGYVSFSSLQTGNYELKVYSNHLSVSTCVATKNFDINIADCNLAISNVVVTNAAADLSTNGSVNFDIAGLECSGYQVTILKDGFAYFSNSVPSIGAVTPVSFSSLPPDDYVILLDNGACNISVPFTVLQGNPTCNLQVSVSNHTNPTGSCLNGSLTLTLSGNTSGSLPYQLLVTTQGFTVLSASYPNSTINVSIPNIPAGIYEITLNYAGSGACVANLSYNLTASPCNISINNLTPSISTCGVGAVSFDVTGTLCGSENLVAIKDTSDNVISVVNWTNGTLISFNSLLPGIYKIIALSGADSPANYCADSVNFSINQIPCDISINNVTPTVSACGIGAVSFIVTGTQCGPESKVFLFDSAFTALNVQDWINGNSISFGNLIPGNYKIVAITNFVSITNYCADTIDFVILPSTCDISINNVTPTVSACGIGAVSFNVTGTQCGTNNLYLLANDAFPTSYLSDNWTVGATITQNGLPPGSYTLVAVTNFTDASQFCADTITFIIAQPICDIAINNLTTSVSACGGQVNFNVSGTQCGTNNQYILINDASPNPGITANWTNGTTIIQNDLPPGNYTLIAITNVVSLTQFCADTVHFTIAPSTCDIAINNVIATNSSCENGAISFNVTGTQCGTNNLFLLANDAFPTSYLSGNWTVGATITQNGLPPGSYTLVAVTNFTDASQFCADTVHFTIQSIVNCDVNITNLSTTSSSCGTGTLQFTINGSQCGATNSYLIVNSAFPDAPYLGAWTSGNLISFTDLYPGNYTLIASTNTTNANCSDTTYFTINDSFNCNIQIENVLVNNATCNSNGDVSFLVTGNQCSSASLAYIYNTSDMLNPVTTLLWSNGIVSSALNLPEGNYIIKALTNNTGDISNSCFDTVSFSINNQNICNLEASNINIHAIACSANFDVDFTVSGNTCGPVEINVYRVSAPSSLVLNASWQSGMNPLVELSSLSAGMYTIQLSDAISGCSSNTPFEIDEINCDIAIINSSISSTGVLYCVNGRIDFDVTGTTCGTGAVALIQNGNILNTINWTTGNGTGLHFENMSPGNYSIVAVNNLFNVTCGDTLDFTINSVLPPLSINNVSISATGVSSCTSGSVSFVVNGQFCENSFVIVYNESNNIVFSAAYNNAGNQTYNISGLAPANYTIEFGLIGYSVTETFIINPNPCNIAVTNVQVNYISGSENCTLANVSFTPTGDMCSNGSVILIRDGLVIDLHLWAMNTAPNLTFNNLAPGNYIIAAGSGSYGYCVGTYNFEVLPANCSLNISSITSTPSNGSNGTIDAIGVGLYCGAVSYTLDAEVSTGNYNNITTNTGNLNTQFTGLAPGNYRVTISSADSPCQDVEYITVVGTACNTSPVISASSLTICPGQTIVLNSNYLIGNVWSNGGTSFNTSITSAGTYTLTVTELNGCTGTTSITITNAITCVPATQMNNGVCGNSSYVKTSSITCLPVSGATQYEWQFSNGSGVYATKITTTNYVLLHSVTPAINWGTNWNIKVRAKIGSNVGPYSADCNIGIITDPTIGGVPLTQLRTQDCGKLNYRINADNRIIANSIAGAIQYEFEFSSSTTGMIFATKLQANNVLFLNTISPALVFPAQYNVRVRARIGATWGVFGTPCLIGIIGLNRDETSSYEVLENISEDIKLETFFDMTVYPNPFNEQATIIIHANNDEQIEVQVFDMLGNLVWKQIVLSNTNIGFGNEFAQGTYVIKAVSQEGNHTRFRFIKSK